MHNCLLKTWRTWFFVLVFFSLGCTAFVSWHEGGRPAMYASDNTTPVLRVGAPEPMRQATAISPYGPGFDFELVSSFCKNYQYSPEWISVQSKDAGFAMLERGEIDVLVGFWGDGPAGHDKAAKDGPAGAESGQPAILGGKAYAHFNPVRISGVAIPEQDRDAQAPPSSDTRDSSALDALIRAFAALLPGSAGNADSAPSHDGEPAPPFPVFSLVMDGNGNSSTDILLLDPASSALWLPFMGDVSTRQIKRQTPFRWFWGDNGTQLPAELDAFWKDKARESQLAELTERYFGFLPRSLRQRDILELAETLASSLQEYADFIKKAAKETGVPPLLLTAAIYQESRFDPGAVSETRVRGIMQLTSNTARMLNVDRKDPEQCIMGGARYLREMYDLIGDRAANDWDRWFMALAAYNQGMGNLNRTIRLAQGTGKKGDTWADLKLAFPQSTTCRGLEAKSFVERIRYYNFILHGLVALAPAETQDFAPLLELAAADL